MKVYEEKGKVIVENISDFNPVHTFLCGQCFRWNEEADGSFTGVAHDRVVNIKSEDNKIIIDNTNLDDFENIWKNYLDLETDYDEIKRTLSKDDKAMTDAINFGSGLKILNQDIYECLISFILSTQNGIPRIKKIIEHMSRLFGKPIEYNGKTYYTFPDVEKLSSLTEKDFEPVKAGYRAAYILSCARAVKNGDIVLNTLMDMPYDEARENLLKLTGVGPKVANCVLLFSLKKREAFPVDVWVERVMKYFYVDEKATVKEIFDYGMKKFGNLGGFAQQYLFYYARENKLGN